MIKKKQVRHPMFFLRITIICLIAVAFSGTAPAQTTGTITVTTATTTFSPGVVGSLERIVAAYRGQMGISVKHLVTSEELVVNGDEIFPTASTIKTAVMCTVFAELSSPTGMFTDYYATRKYDANTSTGGSGFIQNYKDGTKIELKELLHLMITLSDNIGTNMLIDWVGIDRINQWLETNGYKETRLHSTVGGKIIWNQELRKEWGLGKTTPNEMRRMMEMIVTGKANSSTSATDEMLRLLGHQYFDANIAAEAPPTVWVGSKSGSVNDSRSDNAIVASPGGMYVISVYTKNNVDRRWTHENEASIAIQKVAREVYKHFNPNSTWKRPEGTEKL
jgi:beta-lactamase class A